MYIRSEVVVATALFPSLRLNRSVYAGLCRVLLFVALSVRVFRRLIGVWRCLARVLVQQQQQQRWCGNGFAQCACRLGRHVSGGAAALSRPASLVSRRFVVFALR